MRNEVWLRVFLNVGLFWVCFFVVSRIIFLLYHFDQTSTLSAKDVATILLLGFRMDVAMAAYWLILTGLLLSLPARKLSTIIITHHVVTMLLLVISITLVITDLELYSHWGFRMNKTPLFYISSAAAGSVNPVHLVLLIFLYLSVLAAMVFVYFKLIAPGLRRIGVLPVRWAPLMLLITGCLFIPIRSSFSVAPLNTGAVYFHKTKSFPNHAGINVVWNFFNSFSAKDDLKYPENFFPGDAEAIVASIEKTSATSTLLIDPVRPNIIIIIVESFTANIIEPLGGMKGVTPQLNKLVQEGILFDHFYASGDRTDKGLLAILSGYPAQPRTSIIRFPQKTEKLPYLSRAVERLGYHTSFVYGGDISFANMKSYLNTAGFSHITDISDFSSSLDNSKWGVADHYVFDRLSSECDTAKSPFLKVMLTLSSHEPFEVPMKPVFKEAGERGLFLNACYYTDQSIGQFIENSKTKSWWKNTLIIITADHGHRYPNAEELKEKDRFRIPMIWLGGALARRDTVIHTLGIQTDIANTVLGQIDHPQRIFKFSKNLLAIDVKPFAFYSFQNGFGYLDPATEAIYDFDFKKYNRQTGSAENLKYGEAIMQSVFSDYNSR